MARMVRFRWALGVALLWMGAVACADEEAAGQWVQGVVKVTKSAEGAVQAAVIQATDWDENDEPVQVTYNVVLDAKGKKLAAEMHGKEVEAYGVIEKKTADGKPQYWISLREYAVVEEDVGADDGADEGGDEF